MTNPDHSEEEKTIPAKAGTHRSVTELSQTSVAAFARMAVYEAGQ